MNMRRRIDTENLKGLKTFDSYLQEKYGNENSPERNDFDAKAKA